VHGRSVATIRWAGRATSRVRHDWLRGSRCTRACTARAAEDGQGAPRPAVVRGGARFGSTAATLWMSCTVGRGTALGSLPAVGSRRPRPMRLAGHLVGEGYVRACVSAETSELVRRPLCAGVVSAAAPRPRPASVRGFRSTADVCQCLDLGARTVGPSVSNAIPDQLEPEVGPGTAIFSGGPTPCSRVPLPVSRPQSQWAIPRRYGEGVRPSGDRHQRTLEAGRDD
jgi:hypothetical protein